MSYLIRFCRNAGMVRLGALIALVVLAASVLLTLAATKTEKNDPIDRAEYDALMGARVTHLSHLRNWFCDQQDQFDRLIPPGLDALNQPGTPELLVIDLGSNDLPDALRKALLSSTPTYRNSVPTIDVFLQEQHDGSIHLRDNAGNLFYVDPTPTDYVAPYDALFRYSQNPLLYHPELARYRLNARVTLLPHDSVEHYLFAKSQLEEAAELFVDEEPPMQMMMESEDELYISAMTRTTNGLRLELTYPESFSGMVWSAYSYDVQFCPVTNATGSGGSPGLPTNDIPEECTNCTAHVCEFETTNNFMGLEPVWQLVASNVVLTGTTSTVWLDTRPMGLDAQTNPTHRFYGFGANTDSDGDGLNDGYELFVTKTDPFNADTDGDGLPDDWEIENGLNPLSSVGDDGADGDPDGDGLSNALEAQLGLNPQSANSMVPLQASSIVIERAVSGASLSKCGYPDFETGDRKFRSLAVNSQSSREFFCDGSEYLDTTTLNATHWYSELCESNFYVGSKNESTIRNTIGCECEMASMMTWSNQISAARIWWVVSQSPSNCWTSLPGGTNWYNVDAHGLCASCTNTGPTQQSIAWTNYEEYSENCSESWNGLYTQTLTDEYTTGELVGRVQNQFAALDWSTNWQGSGSACRDLSENEATFVLSKMKIRFHIPSTSNGVAYRFSWVRVFTPEDTNLAVQAEAKTVYFAGTGGAAYVGDGLWAARHNGSSSDFYINPPPSDGCVDVSVPSLSISPGFDIVNDGDDSEMFTASITPAHLPGISYAWTWSADSGAGNNPSVSFSAPNDPETYVQQSHWYALPNDTCSANVVSTYKLTCVIIHSGQSVGSSSANLNVTVVEGYTTPPLLQGSPTHSYDSSLNHYYISGTGSLARIPAQVSSTLPAASQFYTKVLAHENQHKQDFDNGYNGHYFVTVAEFYSRIQGFTDSTLTGLAAKVSAEAASYYTDEAAEIDSLRGCLEVRAYQQSDPISPQYWHHNCGQYTCP
ncbi:MAG TPA: hypothetical protein PKE12_02620 [Kiritimatiellia bacterium]|nr:hypothetical protein [Kiritimatiellia bacterium]